MEKSVEKAFSIALTNSDEFSPISIDADLMLWLDASDKSTLDKSNTLGGAGEPKDGESVKFWADKSGHGHHAITSNSGTYLEISLNDYYPSIDTTGDTFELKDSAESFDAWSEMTISMVYQYSSESSWITGIWKHGNGNGNHIQGGWSFDRMNMDHRSAGLWWAKASMVAGEHASRLMVGDSFGSMQSAKVISMRYDGSLTNLKYFANGRFVKESNETEPYFVSNLSETLKIGNSYKWGEILIFKNALPDPKRELIEGYLAHKWGMDSEMDESHPFYENPVVSGYESYEANFSSRAPTDLFLKSNNQVTEGKTIGSVINTIGVVEQDIGKFFEYELVTGVGDEQNSFFKLSEDGELITAKAIDYEQHAELSLRVKVSDDHNQSLSKALTITVVNVVEDADNDGIEDHEDPSIDTDQDGIEDSNDPDIDGDGMTNSEEIANGSDPRDANSVNHAPSSISSNITLSFSENEPAGILVGQLTAVDQDDGAIHEFFLINGDGDTDNSLFTLSEAGELRTAQTFDYDNNASSYSIRVQVRDEYFASIENNFTVTLQNDVWLSPQHLGDNLMLWLDASDPSSLDKGEKLGDLGPPGNSNGVGIWADKSGKEHNARPHPIYNKPKWKSAGFNQLPGIDFASSMMAIDNSAESFDAWSELTLFAVLEHDDVNFSPLFGKTNYAGWMSNDKDMSWAIFTHRLDGNYNHWGPAVITNTPANHYGDLSGKALTGK
jgi:hypothetical protein